MREAYVKLELRKTTMALILKMQKILESYKAQGYVLTVRQLYYQLVAADIISNNEKSYRTIVDTVRDGRLTGFLDWDMIEDRTREFVFVNCWASGKSILESCANAFHKDRWEKQDSRVFCIVEKEALVGVLQRVCTEYDVPLLAARGYPSVSVLRDFGKHTLLPYAEEGKRVIFLHLGDHDPSGIDMSRDLEERLSMFSRYSTFEFRRIALNYSQILELNPPANPAKTTDSRFQEYKKKFGEDSWELDALSPAYLTNLVKEAVESVLDFDAWEQTEREIQEVKDKLFQIAGDFHE